MLIWSDARSFEDKLIKKTVFPCIPVRRKGGKQDRQWILLIHSKKMPGAKDNDVAVETPETTTEPIVAKTVEDVKAKTDAVEANVEDKKETETTESTENTNENASTEEKSESESKSEETTAEKRSVEEEETEEAEEESPKKKAKTDTTEAEESSNGKAETTEAAA
ncbi:hypothetical protein RRG08_054166 [Elysia crispata]|uniref:Uncharacterized protein n=1 Tax=Elysia crispata TaxID=231223 RepID=A0AAE1A2W1_9GAST|nr:hypothetical protein RRG08_054166 [Elysia crispata]